MAVVAAMESGTVRRSMINCSQGDAKRMTIPGGILDADLDAVAFVAWHDPKIAQRAYLLAHHEGALAGILLRRATTPDRRRTALCALCRTTRSSGDVSLYTAARAGASGRAGNSVGTYLCDDLDCPDVVTWEKATATVVPELGVTPEERAESLARRLDGFLATVRRAG
jgi:hypothetical protein